MGCLNGKHVLTDEILDYITNHTKASHDEIKQYHQMFLDEHPNGKITKKCFRKVVQACHPSMDVTGLGNTIIGHDHQCLLWKTAACYFGN